MRILKRTIKKISCSQSTISQSCSKICENALWCSSCYGRSGPYVAFEKDKLFNDLLRRLPLASYARAPGCPTVSANTQRYFTTIHNVENMSNNAGQASKEVAHFNYQNSARMTSRKLHPFCSKHFTHATSDCCFGVLSAFSSFGSQRR